MSYPVPYRQYPNRLAINRMEYTLVFRISRCYSSPTVKRSLALPQWSLYAITSNSQP